MLLREWHNIVEFHTKFGIFKPQILIPLDKETIAFRTKFLQEELSELKTSYKNSLPDFIDALVDLAYVALGSAYMHGDNFEMTHYLCNRGVMPSTEIDLKQQFPQQETFEAFCYIIENFINIYGQNNIEDLCLGIVMLHGIFDNVRLFAIGCGFDWNAHWTEVHIKNLLKERASSKNDARSKRKNSLDIIKPEGWTGPNHQAIIEKTATRLRKDNNSDPSILLA